MIRRTAFYLAMFVLVAVTFYVEAWIGRAYFTPKDSPVPLLGMAAGVAVAALLLGGWKYAPAIAVAVVVFAFRQGGWSPATIALFAFNNTFEALAAWWLLRRVFKINLSLSRLRDVVIFIIFAMTLCAAIGPTLRQATLWVTATPKPITGTDWLTLWLAHAMGIALAVPVTLSWLAQPLPRWRFSKQLEGIALLGLTLLVNAAVFMDWPALDPYRQSIAIMVFPPIIWAALRFGLRGASLVTLLTATAASWAVTHDHGPFGGENKVVVLWGFIVVVAGTSLLLAAATTELRRAQASAARRGRRLDLLAQIVVGITAEMESTQIINRALERVHHFFPRYRLTYATLGPARRFEVIESVGPGRKEGDKFTDPKLTGFQADLAESPVLAEALERLEPVVTRDVAADPRTRPLAQAFRSAGVGSILDVPLRHSDGVVGVIGFDAPGAHRWMAHEVRTLRGVGHQLAIALRDARLQKRQAQDQAELRAGEARLRAAMSASLDSCFLLDAARDPAGRIVDFRFADMNEHAGQWLGKPRAELLGKLICEEFPICRANGFFDCYKRVVETQQPVEQEFELPETVRPSGWYYQQVVPLIDGVALTVRDIRARKDAERALRLSEQRHRTIVEGSPVGLWQITPEGKTLYANTALCDILEVPGPETMVGKQAHDFFPGESGKKVRQELEKRFQGISSTYEAQVRTASGKLRDVVVYGSPLFDADGKLESIIGNFVNITERKHAEQALAESQQMFQSFMQNSPMTAFLKNGEGRYLFVNNAMARMIGKTPEELVGKTDLDIFPLETAQALRRNDAAVLASERTHEFIEHAEQSDGLHHWMVFKFPFRDARGQLLLAGLATDVTQRLRAEEGLRRGEQLSRQAAESNRRLLAEVNHRVRNNLASLISLLRLLRKRVASVEVFADALESRFMAMSQVHNMLSGAGWGDLDLHSLVTDLLAAMQQAATHPTPLHVDGPAVRIHPRQSLPLALTLMEMFTNGAKHGAHRSPGGSVEVTWKTAGTPRSPTLSLHWRETGGPPIAPGEGKPSLGTELIEGFISFELGGKCTLSYPASGADHLIEFPLEGGPT